MTEQSKPQPAPATREEMARELVGCWVNTIGPSLSLLDDWEKVAGLVQSWLAAERALALEEAATLHDCDATRLEKWARDNPEQRDADPEGWLSNEVERNWHRDYAADIRSLASEQKDAAR